MGITERRVREKEQRRSDIIDAAEKVFFSRGVHQSTMDDVAMEAELSKGTLYLYFKSKEDLHFAISMRGMDVLSEKLQQAYDISKTGAENALEIGKAYIGFSKQYRNYFDSFLEFEASTLETVDPLQKEKIFGDGSPLMVFVHVIEKGQKDGSIRDDIPSRELAVILWSQLTGLLQFARNKLELVDLLGYNKDDLLMDHFRIIQDGIIRGKKVVTRRV
ncbi:MAG: TetR/AcrR family transcriptional regulator [Bacteroidales bacterium]